MCLIIFYVNFIKTIVEMSNLLIHWDTFHCSIFTSECHILLLCCFVLHPVFCRSDYCYKSVHRVMVVVSNLHNVLFAVCTFFLCGATVQIKLTVNFFIFTH